MDERIADLVRRLEALETLAAHQEAAIGDLSGVLAEQWGIIDMLKARVAALTETLEEVAAGAGEVDPQKRPPHW